MYTNQENEHQQRRTRKNDDKPKDERDCATVGEGGADSDLVAPPPLDVTSEDLRVLDYREGGGCKL
ncbi:hypothetical protein TSUD_372450 [Trifolium subterraneum]|uniref:Uncharacterized protein n=1 Tax=Trifolium subterraneum TaxID=3900 RepID=A0A2Z6NGG9_TRISU|nr:hypothetical protein TSUD_372450 [Trifolium subterraneum]